MKNIIGTLILCLCVILKIKGLDAANYNWNCSPLDHGHHSYYVPSLGEKFNGNFFGEARREKQSSPPTQLGSISIYPASSTLSCSGTVSAVRYCYRIYKRKNFGQNIFTLLFLHQNKLTFNITREFTVWSKPTPKICNPYMSWQYCCDTRTLSKVHLPSSGFAFGIINTELLYLPEFNVRHYKVALSAKGRSQIEVQSGSIQQKKPLPYLQFIVSPAPATAAPATFSVAPTVAATTIATTRGKDTHASTSENNMTSPTIATTPTSSGKDAPTVATTTIPTTITSGGKDMHATTSEDNKTPTTVVVVKRRDGRITISIAVATAVVGLALLFVIICVVGVVLKKRHLRPRNATLLPTDSADADDSDEHEYDTPTIVYVNQQQQELTVHHNTAYGVASSDQIAVSPNLAYVVEANTARVVLSTNPAYGASMGSCGTSPTALIQPPSRPSSLPIKPAAS